MKRDFIEDADVDNEEEMADSVDATVWDDVWASTEFEVIGTVIQ